MGCKLIKLKVAAGLWWGILQKWEWNAVAVDGAYFEAVGLVIRTQNFHSLPDRILGFTVKTNRDPATRHPESQGCYPDNVLSGWHLTPPLKHSSPSACPQLLQRERDGSRSAEAWAIASFLFSVAASQHNSELKSSLNLHTQSQYSQEKTHQDGWWKILLLDTL